MTGRQALRDRLEYVRHQLQELDGELSVSIQNQMVRRDVEEIRRLIGHARGRCSRLGERVTHLCEVQV